MKPNKKFTAYLIEFQKKCQSWAEEENPSMKSYNEICKMVSERQDIAKHEVPIALDAIVHLESHPSPSESDTVKFVHLYKMISDMMKGFPVDELDDVNKLVLMEAYTELMMAVESPRGKEDLKKLETLFSQRVYEASAESDLIQELRTVLGETSFNLFGLPTEFLVRIKK